MLAKGLFPAVITLATLLAGCSSAPPTPPDNRAADAKAIRDTEAAWSQAMATKDSDKITAYYAEDASLFVPEMPVVTGKANIASVFKTLVDDKNFALSFSADKAVASRSGDLGFTQGGYTMTSTNPRSKKPVTDKGKYVTVYMKQADGGWKAVADIFNTDEQPGGRSGKNSGTGKGKGSGRSKGKKHH
jgi:ketosteroid isomerase-like protein